MILKIGMQKILCFCLILVFSNEAYTQSTKEKGAFEEMLNFNIGYGGDFPGGDLAERFGSNLRFNIGMEYIFKSNYSIGADLSFLFGTIVKIDALSPFRAANGFIYGANTEFAEIFQRQRGYFAGAYIGKIFPFNEYKSGLKLILGGGIFQHQIRFVDDTQTVAQVTGAYRKGLDRLTRGPALKEGIGYQIHSKSGLINGSIMFEFIQAFTQQVRKVNFDTGERVEGSRLDLLFGFRANWILPIIRTESSEKIYYY